VAEYVDDRPLGRGGFGEVWSCVRADDGLPFAKKRLIDDSPEAAERFRREVRILSKLNHHRVIKIEDTHLEEPPLWYVMPLYGQSLADAIPGLKGDRVRITKVFASILEGMQYAHAQGILHRDLTPRNVLLNADEDVVVCDFGLGRDTVIGLTRATRTGDYMGTQGYAAPEQVRDAKRADHRSDIFSLGRILAEMYTGEFPEGFYEFGALPDSAAMIVERATRPDPEARFQSVREMASAFSLLEVGRRAGAKEELKDLSGQLLVQRAGSEEQIAKLADLIVQYSDETMLLHDVAVEIDGKIFSDLYRASPEAARLLVKQFCATCVSQTWPFDYTDKIAGACSRLFRATDDTDIKALVTTTVLRVGVSHNRWYVMDVTAALVEKTKDTKDALALAKLLEAAQSDLWAIEDRVKIEALHPALRALFNQKKE
jgi:serine/threonine protein kinase